MGTAVMQAEVAKRLGVHPNTVANMLNDGRLKAVEFGNFSGHQRSMRRVDAASVEQLVRLPHATGKGARKWDHLDSSRAA